jgi:hypothetical protein
VVSSLSTAAWRAWGRTVTWAVGLAIVAGIYGIGAEALAGGVISVWRPLAAAVGHLGILLPFAAMAGGLVLRDVGLPRSQRRRAAVLVGASVAVVSYGALAFARPAVEYRLDAANGVDVAVRHPFGPATPIALARLRRFVTENPPAEFSMSVEQPLAHPPNWVSLGLHQPAAFALFAVLAVLFGTLVAELTFGLSPPARRQARWAAALLCGMGFFVASVVGDSWVRGATERSAVLGAWLPMVIPVLGCWLLAGVARRRARGDSGAGGVDGRR